MVTDIGPTTRRRARLTNQGQITVPKAVRDALGLRPGDDIEFVRRDDGFVVEARPRLGVLDFAGLAAAAAARTPATAEAIDALLAAGMAAEAAERQAKIERDAGGGG
jgi:AbrB family looped-hinge helix DNA binding protein